MALSLERRCCPGLVSKASVQDIEGEDDGEHATTGLFPEDVFQSGDLKMRLDIWMKIWEENLGWSSDGDRTLVAEAPEMML